MTDKSCPHEGMFPFSSLTVGGKVKEEYGVPVTERDQLALSGRKRLIGPPDKGLGSETQA